MIIFRADGSTAIGLGHITRSLALADMLSDEFDIAVAIKDPSPQLVELISPVTKNIITLRNKDWQKDAYELADYVSSEDLVVLDGYNFDTAYQQIIKQKAKRVVFLDDIHAWHYVADVIINQSDSVTKANYSLEPYTRLFTGMKYALLRKPFLEAALSTRKIEKIDTCFISMGGADITNATEKTLRAVVSNNKYSAVHVLVGPLNPHKRDIRNFINGQDPGRIHYHEGLTAMELCRLLNQCQIALCPASSLSIEACAVGIGLGTGFTAANQWGILDSMEKSKTILNFGDLNAISIEEIAEKVEELSNIQTINEQIANQRKLVDGRSPERLRNIFRNL